MAALPVGMMNLTAIQTAIALILLIFIFRIWPSYKVFQEIIYRSSASVVTHQKWLSWT